MSLPLNSLIGLAVDSVRAPRDSARLIQSVNLTRAERWQALLLVVVVSVVLAQISTVIAPPQTEVVMGRLLQFPLITAIVQMSLMIVMVYAIFWIGRALGGRGGFADTILLVAWMQFVMICLQVLQLAAMLVLPPLAGLIGVAGLGLFFWLLTNFVAELHGFSSLGKVFLMILLALVGIAFGMSVILSIIGITVPGA